MNNINKNDANHMRLIIDSKSENEAFARVAVAAFVTQLDPTVEELADIKTAVSEAVTNSIVHGYEERDGKVEIDCVLDNQELSVTIVDWGCGIEDINKAMEPAYTTKSELERSGMGFVFMNMFMDSLNVKSEVGQGTIVQMKKKINSGKRG